MALVIHHFVIIIRFQEREVLLLRKCAYLNVPWLKWLYFWLLCRSQISKTAYLRKIVLFQRTDGFVVSNHSPTDAGAYVTDVIDENARPFV